jgi:hypothetical protein
LVVSSTEAYLALSDERQPRGPNGEPRISRIVHTINGGKSWNAIPWTRSVVSILRYPGFPNWPPEAVLEIKKQNGRLTIVHRDEWVPFEPGGESLWRSTLMWGWWWNRKIRAMNYEGSDSAMPPPAAIMDQLPPSIKPPNQMLQPTDLMSQSACSMRAEGMPQLIERTSPQQGFACFQPPLMSTFRPPQNQDAHVRCHLPRPDSIPG